MTRLRPAALVLMVSLIVGCGEVSVPVDSTMNSSAGLPSLPDITDANQNLVAASSNGSVPAINPRHGEPGHRCDIPVGQPLINSNTTTYAVPAAINGPVSKVTPAAMPTTAVRAPLLNPNLRPATNPGLNYSTNTSTGILNPAHGQPGHRCDIAVGQLLSSAPATASSTISSTTNTAAVGPGLNPAHGQPGHRCDLKVGAPLNSAPATTANSSVPSATASTTTNDAPVAPGMNPKHGQPGHRCDIAVGQPLNSAPKNKTTSPVAAPATASPATSTTTDTTLAGPRLNPKHGQPGHRCDIPSGQPLPISATTTPTSAINSPATTSPIISSTTDTTFVATGLNPKHGQPGHRCDIKVGAPLNSKAGGK